MPTCPTIWSKQRAKCLAKANQVGGSTTSVPWMLCFSGKKVSSEPQSTFLSDGQTSRTQPTETDQDSVSCLSFQDKICCLFFIFFHATTDECLAGSAADKMHRLCPASTASSASTSTARAVSTRSAASTINTVSITSTASSSSTSSTACTTASTSCTAVRAIHECLRGGCNQQHHICVRMPRPGASSASGLSSLPLPKNLALLLGHARTTACCFEEKPGLLGMREMQGAPKNIKHRMCIGQLTHQQMGRKGYLSVFIECLL